MIHLDRYSDALLGKMWKTKSARFNAHARLSFKQNLSTTAVTILAFYIFVAALVPLVQPSVVTPAAAQLVSVLAVIMSVFLIIVTLLESARDYQIRSDKMHKCALEISELYNRVQAMSVDEAEKKRVSLADEYSDILKRHEANHENIDFIRVELMFWRELKVFRRQYIVKLIRYGLLVCGQYWFYCVLIVGPPVIGIGLFVLK